MTVHIGIDPGKTGAIAFIEDDGTMYWFNAKDMMEGSRIDVLDDARREHNNLTHCWIEGQGARSPGRKACFELGGSYYGWRMACLAAGVGFTIITAPTWRKLVKAPIRAKDGYSERKRQCKALAQQYYPEARKGITLQNADAILIAHACKIAMGAP